MNKPLLEAYDLEEAPEATGPRDMAAGVMEDYKDCCLSCKELFKEQLTKRIQYEAKLEEWERDRPIREYQRRLDASIKISYFFTLLFWFIGTFHEAYVKSTKEGILSNSTALTN